MDITAIGIAAGIIFAVAYSLTLAIRQRSFEIGKTILVFLAGFAIPGGAKLIFAGFTGQPSELPSIWREYVAVAGIVAIGLSAHYIIQCLRLAWAKSPHMAAAASTQPLEEASIEQEKVSSRT